MTATKPILGNTTYDIAKDAATMWLPGLGVFYTTLATIWGLPYPIEVAGTVAAIAALLGVFLKISTTQYAKAPENNAGTIVVNTSDTTVPDVMTSVRIPVAQLKGVDSVTLKVVDASYADTGHGV